MAIVKKTVAAAVSAASSSSAKKAKVEVTDWDSILLNAKEDDANTSTDGKEYEFFNGKDRLVRTCPGWGEAKGKTIKFVIYATDGSGNPLPELPSTKFGTIADVEYMERRYPLNKGFFVADNLCKNGRHKINVYRIHICGVIDTPVEVE